MAEDIRIIQDVPNHGSRRTLELYRLTDNEFTIRFKNKDDQDVDVSNYAVQCAGKRHESDSAEVFDVAGTVSAVSGAFAFTIPIASAGTIFSVPGIAEFRWFKDGVASGSPDGRHRLPLLIHREIGT